MTKCSTCETLKPASEFYKNRTKKNGLNTQCKSCSKIKPKDRAGKRKCRRCKNLFYRERGADYICLRCKQHCSRCDVLLTEKNQDKSAKKRNAYRCKNCVAECVKNTRNPHYQREYDLLRNYFITVNEYEKLFESQGGVCWICKKPPTNHKLSVDHKHEPREKRRDVKLIRNRVRGLLCWKCNTALAKFDDNPDFLRKAADYLEEIPAQKILRRIDASK